MPQPQTIPRDDPRYPVRLRQRLGAHAPSELTALGNLNLLSQPTTALFCSARCPGKLILRTYDQAAQWRDAGHCVVSGFHSPVEKECLRILLRGEPPIIICLARGMPKRIPPDWKKPLADGRLLILSIFPQTESRITADLAARRNELGAALADQVFVAYATPGGRLETSLRQLTSGRGRNVALISGSAVRQRGGNFRFDLGQVMLEIRAGLHLPDNSLGEDSSGVNIRWVMSSNP